MVISPQRWRRQLRATAIPRPMPDRPHARLIRSHARPAIRSGRSRSTGCQPPVSVHCSRRPVALPPRRRRPRRSSRRWRSGRRRPKSRKSRPYRCSARSRGRLKASVFSSTPRTRDVVRLRVGEDRNGWILKAVMGREATLEKATETAVLQMPAPGASQPDSRSTRNQPGGGAPHSPGNATLSAPADPEAGRDCGRKRLGRDCGMDGSAMPHQRLLRRHELPQRGVDRVEIDIGDEAIDAGIDAARLRTEHEAALAD